MTSSRTDDPNYHDPDQVDGKPALATCFPRYCDHCGTGMHDGWVHFEGNGNWCSDECIVASKVLPFVKSLNDLRVYWGTVAWEELDDYTIFWTEWYHEPHNDWHCDCNA